MKRIIDPKEILTKDLHQYIIGAIAPRPIAFVSTIDDDGSQNLAPYSFFNAFSSNPPILVFSSNRKVSNNTIKDTLYNVRQNKEVVINVVNYDIVRQMSLASVEFPKGESEFLKTGLTPMPAIDVSPFLVHESPVNMECKVVDVITLGEKGGAGHLIICEVLKLHISEHILDGDRINPHKIDLMGRMGRSYYVRASGSAVSEIYQGVINDVLGFDRLPEFIRKNNHLNGNEIAVMAACKAIPTDVVAVNTDLSKEDIYDEVKALLANEEGEQALRMLISYHNQGIL